MKRLCCLFLVLTIGALGVEAKKRSQNKPSKKPKRGQFVIAPIPVSNPAVGGGLVVVAGYVFKLNESDTVSPPSTIGLAGAFTSNGSRGGGVAGRLYFDRNRYQTTVAFGKAASITTSSVSGVCRTDRKSQFRYIRKAVSSSASFSATSVKTFSSVRVISIAD